MLRVCLIVLCIVCSCAPPEQESTLSARTRGELDDLAEQVYRDTEEKYHILNKIMVKVMEEGLDLGGEDALANHLNRFSTDNEWALGILKEEIDVWYKAMEEDEQREFLLQLMAEDYPRKLRRLVPAVKQRLSGREQALASFEKLLETVEFRR